MSIYLDSVGLQHPDTSTALVSIGTAHWKLGDLDKARDFYERALAVDEATIGRDHLSVAITLNNLASVTAESDPALAEAWFRRALEIRRAQLSANHPLVASSVSNLATLLALRGETEPAKAMFRRALAAKEAELGPEHPSLAYTLMSLGTVERKGSARQALTTHRRAATILEKALGRNHPQLSEALLEIDLDFMEMDKPARAIEPLLRSVRIEGDDQSRAKAQFALAKALSKAGKRKEARQAIEKARLLAEALGNRGKSLLDSIAEYERT